MFNHILRFGLLQFLLTVEISLAIWPIPRNISTGQETLLLSRNFRIISELSTTPQDLTDAIGRTQRRLFEDNLGRLVVGRGSSDSDKFNSSKTLRSLRLSLTDKNGKSTRSISEESIMSLDARNENYLLNIPADGSNAILEASTTLGLLRGLTTFEQLWYTFSGQVYAVDMPLHVRDSPAFVSESAPL